MFFPNYAAKGSEKPFRTPVCPFKCLSFALKARKQEKTAQQSVGSPSEPIRTSFLFISSIPNLPAISNLSLSLCLFNASILNKTLQ
jgi:hypothetical protein